MKWLPILGVCLALAAPIANAASTHCPQTASNSEEYRYTWRLRGGLGWIAGFVFPRTGYGDLRTDYPATSQTPLHSELLITSAESKNGFYKYESDMDADAGRTLTTYHGYAWGNKSRKEKTAFDYTKRVARIHKETPDKTSDTVKLLDAPTTRDVLTAIHYLRTHADRIHTAITTSIYSDGKEYPVMLRPTDPATFTLDNQSVRAIGFEIVDAPGGKRWPGGVKVWLSDDARRIPFRIQIEETLASLQLDLDSIEACGFLNSRK